MKPLDKGSVRNYAKCGPYGKEPRGSAVKVVPGHGLGNGDAELLVYRRRLVEGGKLAGMCTSTHPPA